MWSLQDENKQWITVHAEQTTAVPFWPEKEFAEACSKTHWPQAQVKSITLHMFRTHWLFEIFRAQQKVAVFPHPETLSSVHEESMELLEDIRQECLQYQ